MEEVKKQKQKKTPLKIFLDVLEWVLIGVSVCLLAAVIVFASGNPGNDGKGQGSFFGFQTRLVVSGSMDADGSFYQDKNWSIKRIQTGSVVFMQNASKIKAEDIHVDDVVCFTHPLLNVATTHRVIAIEQKSSVPGGYVFTTQGDKVRSEGDVLSTESFYWGNVIGKITGTSKFIGDMYTNLFSKKWVLLLIILVPTVGVISYEAVKVADIVKKDKKAKLIASTDEDDIKMVELEKELEELKKKKRKGGKK